MSKQGLEGLKVLDFCWVIAGPMLTKFLAAYGATVVRVETTAKTCSLRTNSPFKDGKPGINRSGYFAYLNPNKYGIQLNLSHPKGKDVAQRLIQWADVIAENFAPGTLDRLGLDYQALKKLNPDIVLVSLSAQGQTGPYARHVGLGYHLAGVGGFVDITGWPDREPIDPFSPYTDLVAPDLAASAVLAALEYRDSTGRGQHLDISQFEAGLQYLTPVLLDWNVNRHEFSRSGNYCPTAAPHGVYRCRGEERWCAITALSEDHWLKFKEIINSAWCIDSRFMNLTGRKENESELDRLVEAWTLEHDAENIEEQLQSAGIPASVVNTPADIYSDPDLRERGVFWEMEHPGTGVFPLLGQSALLSETPAQPRMPAPSMGQHTEYVCKEFLKMSDEEFVELLNAGIFE